MKSFSNRLHPRVRPVALAKAELMMEILAGLPPDVPCEVVFLGFMEAVRHVVNGPDALMSPLGSAIIEKTKVAVAKHSLTPSETVAILAELLAREADVAVAQERSVG